LYHIDLGDDYEPDPCVTREQFKAGMAEEARDEDQEVDVSIEDLEDACIHVVGKGSDLVILTKIILKMDYGILKVKGVAPWKNFKTNLHIFLCMFRYGQVFGYLKSYLYFKSLKHSY